MDRAVYQKVTDAAQLQEVIQILEKAKAFAIDLEFDKNRFRFGFNLCLMQIATEEEVFLIDPLSDALDIRALFPILEDQSILKVAFEFGEDIRLLHSLGCQPRNVEDLSNASKLLGYAQLSLSNLIAQVLQIELKQGEQMSNWFQRPLTQAQCKYAADDVSYLFELRNTLLSRLKALNDDRVHWYSEENAFFAATAAADQHKGGQLTLNKEDRQALNQVQYHVLKRLHAERLKQAKHYNRPEFKVLSTLGLIELVRSGPSKPHLIEKEIGLKSLRTSVNFIRWKQLLVEAWSEAEALGLSTDQSAFLSLSDEDKRLKRDEQKHINRLVEEQWKPVQSKLRKRFGAEVATYLLSNRTMKRLAGGDTSGVPGYRLALFNALLEQE